VFRVHSSENENRADITLFGILLFNNLLYCFVRLISSYFYAWLMGLFGALAATWWPHTDCLGLWSNFIFLSKKLLTSKHDTRKNLKIKLLCAVQPHLQLSSRMG
jgi:hypothetical protein